MLKAKNELVVASTLPNLAPDAVKIDAGSIVYDNNWINYNSTTFKIEDYILSVVQPPRTRFFKDRNYGLILLVGLNVNEGIKAIEGKHVPFTTIDALPYPDFTDIIPLVGIVLIQDGSNNLNTGYKPLRPEYIKYFSGAGNVLQKNLQGPTGADSDIVGSTGALGLSGVQGAWGFTGLVGPTGYQGIKPPQTIAETGLQGMTGISWNIHIPFVEFS